MEEFLKKPLGFPCKLQYLSYSPAYYYPFSAKTSNGTLWVDSILGQSQLYMDVRYISSDDLCVLMSFQWAWFIFTLEFSKNNSNKKDDFCFNNNLPEKSRAMQFVTWAARIQNQKCFFLMFKDLKYLGFSTRAEIRKAIFFFLKKINSLKFFSYTLCILNISTLYFPSNSPKILHHIYLSISCSPFIIIYLFILAHWVQLMLLLCTFVWGHPLDHEESASG